MKNKIPSKIDALDRFSINTLAASQDEGDKVKLLNREEQPLVEAQEEKVVTKQEVPTEFYFNNPNDIKKDVVVSSKYKIIKNISCLSQILC